MKFKKDDLVKVRHDRKGKFYGVVLEDFDSEKDEWFPIALLTGTLKGLAKYTTWEAGERVPCRNSLCKIEKHSHSFEEDFIEEGPAVCECGLEMKK